MRKAGLNIVMSMKGDGKPVSFIEDCAVPLEHLADYTDAPDRACSPATARSGTWYAHASVGCLHVRPILNLKQEKDVARDARDRRGGVRDGARIQGLAFRRARRRPGALRVPRGDVRRRAWCAPSRRSRTASTRRACSTPARSCAPRAWTTAALFRYPPGYRAAAARDGARLVAPGAAFSAPPRCATTTAPAASPTPA